MACLMELSTASCYRCQTVLTRFRDGQSLETTTNFFYMLPTLFNKADIIAAEQFLPVYMTTDRIASSQENHMKIR